MAVIFPFIEIPILAVYFSAFCWIGAAWVIFLFRQKWGLEIWQVAIIGGVVIASGWVAFLGMQAYLFTFLLVLSLSLFLSRHYLLAGFFTGLLFLTRGEGILILAVLVTAEIISSWHQNNRIDHGFVEKVIRLCAGFAIPVSLWAFYAYLTFGSILPNTLVAKQAQLQNGLGRPFVSRLIHEWIPLWGREFQVGPWKFINLWWVIIAIGFISAVLSKKKVVTFCGLDLPIRYRV